MDLDEGDLLGAAFIPYMKPNLGSCWTREREPHEALNVAAGKERTPRESGMAEKVPERASGEPQDAPGTP